VAIGIASIEPGHPAGSEISGLGGNQQRPERLTTRTGNAPSPPAPRFPVWKPRYIDGGVFPWAAAFAKPSTVVIPAHGEFR
jgi:hypothetical protein